MEDRIKLSLPHLTGKEKEYVDRAVDSTWIVPLGPFVDEFEQRLESYLGDCKVVALNSGTSALHLAMLLAGVQRDSKVICQSMTFAATANPIAYIGAEPIFIDSEPDTWNASPLLIRNAVNDILARGEKPAAVVVTDLYGMPAKLREISALCAEFDIPLIEDAAEAIGSEYMGRKCGTFGFAGALSFNGNKMITTSGGGALICHSADVASRAKFLATQARENRPYYYHETIGYNYRLSNVSAAIGCAQMEMLPDRVSRRREINSLYAKAFADNPYVTVHTNPSHDYRSNFWLTTILLSPDAPLSPDQLRIHLDSAGIESRLLWRPMHMQPVFATATVYLDGNGDGCSGRLFSRGLCLPSGSTLTDAQILRVAKTVNQLLCD